jgi:hypothetical protein
MSNTPAAQLARAKLAWPLWTLTRAGDLYTATPRNAGPTLRACSLAELEEQIPAAEWRKKHGKEGTS